MHFFKICTNQLALFLHLRLEHKVLMSGDFLISSLCSDLKKAQFQNDTDINKLVRHYEFIKISK